MPLLMIDRRLFLPIIAGVVLFAVSTWRIAANKRQNYADQLAAANVMRPVSSFHGEFEAVDSDNHLVRLAGYLGRHRIILLFFDGQLGADKDEELLRLRERFAELKAHDVKVIAISSALPQQHRAAIEESRAGPFPFPLVSDFDSRTAEGQLRIHRHWKRLAPRTNVPLQGVFLIDRKGMVAYGPNGPKPMLNVDAAVTAVLREAK